MRRLFVLLLLSSALGTAHAEIIERIKRLKRLLEEDPFLGKTFDDPLEFNRAQALSIYGQVSAAAEIAHLAQLLAHHEAAAVVVLEPSEEDRQKLVTALEGLHADFAATDSFGRLLAKLTDALEEMA